MSSFETAGLRVTEVAHPDELRAELEHAGPERPNMVQLTLDDDRRWEALRDPDLVVRPTWLHWVASASGGSAALVERQSPKQRRRSRTALSRLDRMTMEISEPIDESRYDEWAELYSAQVKGMRLGHDFAARYRSGTLAPDSPFLLVTWREDGELAGGVVVRFDPELSALVTRFSAVAPGRRGAEIPRGMYLALADLAASRGMRWLSLGNDINLYGTVTHPGLCAFKLRLGFRPVPGDLFGNSSCRTVAERLVDVRDMDLPVLRFEYAGPREPDAELPDFIDGAQALRLVSVMPAGSGNAVLESLPDHRRIVLVP
ncbi:hypothetical protein OG596_31950 [Streptomyces sp. NBC_01102]|uniref:hypothetical protein n=1 Tax=unclassified Streptomyces TaxID=2593676 RepID=UPI00386E5307|nr:hypothetical protein OG596_31950 [Streptomyces sp. NBC_01102]